MIKRLRVPLYIWIGLFGSLGAMSRAAVSFLNELWFWPTSFPWGTLLCNLVGCFLLSFIAYSKYINVSETLRTAVMTGFIGSFTTFSAFSVETMRLIQAGDTAIGIGYAAFSLATGWLAVWFGLLAANYVDSLRSERRERLQ